MYKFSSILFTALIWLSFGAKAQQSKAWTLEECIEYALNQNITVRKSDLSIQSYEASAEQAKAQRFPSLSASIGQSYQWKDSDYSSGTNYSGSTSAVFFNGFKINNQIKQAKLDVEGGKYSLEATKESISLSILDAYLQVLYAEEQVKNSEKQIESTSEQLRLAEERLALQVISQSDYSEVKSQLASEKLTLANANSTLAIARVNLMQLMELPVTDDFTIVKPILQEPLNRNYMPDVNAVFDTALAIKPQIKSAAVDKEIAALDEKIAKASYFPTLSATGGLSYSTNYSSQSSGLLLSSSTSSTWTPSVNLSLSIPIYQKRQAKTSVEIARIGYQNAELSELDTKNTLRKSIEQACLDVSTAQIKYEASMESYHATQESLSLSEEQFKQGVINSVDYLISKTNMIVAESELLQSKYNLIYCYKVLDFYLGNPLSL